MRFEFKINNEHANIKFDHMINNCFNLFIAFFRTPQIYVKLEVIIVFGFALEASLWPSLFTNFIFCGLNRESVRTSHIFGKKI